MQTLIQIVDLKKHFKTKNNVVKALDGVSLEIFKGEIISLLGVNGAGKTTLSSILATINPPTSGDIIFNGVSIYNQLNEFRHNIGFCPQKPNLDKDLTVEQNLIYAGRFMNMPEDAIAQRANELIKKYELEKYRHAKSDSLSGGYARRVLIARSLMHNPKIFILDEPTVALDPHIRRQLWETITELKQSGVTVILTTHYLDEAEFLSDRICIMDKGKVMLINTPEDLMQAYEKSKLEDVFLQLFSEDTE